MTKHKPPHYIVEAQVRDTPPDYRWDTETEEEVLFHQPPLGTRARSAPEERPEQRGLEQGGRQRGDVIATETPVQKWQIQSGK